MIRVHPARTVDLPGVAAVLQDVFSDKLRVIVSSQPEKVRMLLEAAYTGPVQRGFDGVLVAERDGRIVGTLLIGPMYYTPLEKRAFEHLAVRELGMPRMLRAAFLLWLLGHRAEPDEAYVTDLAVARDYQGQGIAARIRRALGARARPRTPDAVGGREQSAGGAYLPKGRFFGGGHPVQPDHPALLWRPALVVHGKTPRRIVIGARRFTSP